MANAYKTIYEMHIKCTAPRMDIVSRSATSIKKNFGHNAIKKTKRDPSNCANDGVIPLGLATCGERVTPASPVKTSQKPADVEPQKSRVESRRST